VKCLCKGDHTRTWTCSCGGACTAMNLSHHYLGGSTGWATSSRKSAAWSACCGQGIRCCQCQRSLFPLHCQCGSPASKIPLVSGACALESTVYCIESTLNGFAYSSRRGSLRACVQGQLRARTASAMTASNVAECRCPWAGGCAMACSWGE
jgi:hypothetical protein